MWELSKPWDLIVDFHSVEGKLIKDAVLLHLPGDNIGVKLVDEARRAVVFDDFNDALLHFFVLDDFLFKRVSV